MYPENYLNIISAICLKHSIEIQKFPNEPIIKLTKNEKIHYIWSRRFDLNTSIASRIADNKFATYTVLNTAGISVVECYKLFRADTEEYVNGLVGTIELCQKLLKTNNAIVIKPNNSYEGTDVFKCTSIKEIEQTLYQIGHKYKTLIVAPYVEATAEFRIFYLNGNALFAYQKILPYLVADGKLTVLELLLKSKYNIKQIDQSILNQFGIIYPYGHKIELNWKFNLSQGALCATIENFELLSKLSDLAINAAKSIGISFATVDILMDVKKQLKVLEINAGVAMDQFIRQHPHGTEIATSIYEEAILIMFQ